MSFQLLSRRNLFGRLFGAAAFLVGWGRSAAAAPVAEPTDTAPLEGVTHYTFDDRGRLISIDERPAPCDASQETHPPPTSTSWTYDHVGGRHYGTR